MSHKFKKPSKVVSSGEIKPDHHLPSFKKDKKAILTVVIALVVLLVGAGAYFLYHNNATKNGVSTACTDKAAGNTLEQASKVLAPSKVTELQPIVKKIETFKNYQKDSNCLAVITVYYINTSDAKNAQPTLSSLTKLYQPNTGYNAAIKGKILPPSGLKPTVDYLSSQAKAIDDNPKQHGASNGY